MSAPEIPLHQVPLFCRPPVAISAARNIGPWGGGVRRLIGVTGLVVAALALGGCGSSGSWMGSGQQQAGQPAAPVQNPAGAGAPIPNAIFGQPIPAQEAALRPDLCPRIEVRDGSNIWRTGGEGPTELVYQATITDVARECRIDGQTMTIRAGIEGRLLVGPKGGAGRATLPIRIAVAPGLSGSVWTRLYQVAINVPADSPSVAFTQVEDAISFPLPEPAALANYIVWVGFDTQAQVRDQPVRNRPRRARAAAR